MRDARPTDHRRRTWHDLGAHVTVDGRRIFVVESGPATPEATVIVHGFPGSSHDFAGVLARLPPERRVVLVDLLGFGHSDKPLDVTMSLFAQADVVERVMRHLGVERAQLVAHDMGDTVVAELLARRRDGRLGVDVDGAILTNGSIFIDLACLTRGQRLGLRMPDRTLPTSLPAWFLRRSVRESFAPGAPPPDGAIDDLVTAIRHGGGGRILLRQIRYIEERRVHQERWTAGLVDFDGPLTLLWGEQDPIAVPAMAERLARLRPGTDVVTWPDVGHWPSLEVPERVADAIVARTAWSS
ncbi:MAG: alpha/beta hydrolase [Solirubrobacteraceae bacterium]|nr:alpha/beta hydrolase [Solirubrobacteraceae bacterium]